MTPAKILIVEDEIIVARDLQRTLLQLGYDVPSLATSGKEAIDLVGRHHPDLVLMDIVLRGDMDGIETAREIHLHLDIPVVYLTAYSDTQILKRAKITEPFGYIAKPYGERELHATIEIALYKDAMEKKLKDRQAWLAAILRSIGDAVIAADGAGRVIFMNAQAELLTGWNRQDAEGRPSREVITIVNEDTGETAPSANPETISEATVEILAGNTTLIGKDGRRTPIDASRAPIADGKGSGTGVVLVFRDVAERRRLEEERQKIQKLESLGVLAGGIAHDFNNILTAILGTVSLAKLRIDHRDELADSLSCAEEACIHAKDLTRQLLTFAKGGMPIRSVASISNLLRESVEFALRGSNVQGAYLLPDALWPAEVDTGQIRQVVYNLVMNAVQAMPEGGKIQISAENIVVRGGGEAPLKDGNYLKIRIRDHGAGIPRHYLPKIFEPYFTTKQHGSGLGLATCFSIVKKHDGHIAVDSELGVGTVFDLYLPASSKAAPADVDVAKATPVTEKSLHGQGRILVMDDDEFIITLTSRALEQFGHDVVCARDGRELITLYREIMNRGGSVDAFIIDLTIPGGMGGRQTIQELLKIDSGVVAIVSSGYSDDPVLANFREYGFRDALPKPYTIEDLIAVLNRVMPPAKRQLGVIIP